MFFMKHNWFAKIFLSSAQHPKSAALYRLRVSYKRQDKHHRGSRTWRNIVKALFHMSYICVNKKLICHISTKIHVRHKTSIIVVPTLEQKFWMNIVKAHLSNVFETEGINNSYRDCIFLLSPAQCWSSCHVCWLMITVEWTSLWKYCYKS